MPTPSFEKRLRRDRGSKVEFDYTSGKSTRHMIARVNGVEWNENTSSYVFVGRQTSGNRSVVRIPTSRIQRPVRRIR